jgi:hypothetical protein
MQLRLGIFLAFLSGGLVSPSTMPRSQPGPEGPFEKLRLAGKLFT